MTAREIPFDVSYDMPDGLRARANDPQGMAAAVDWLVDHAREADAAGRRSHLADYVHQHLGKALLEAGDPAGAVTHLEQALASRTRKGDPGLIDSGRAALATARRAAGERP